MEENAQDAMRKAIMEINRSDLPEAEKAKKRQELMMGRWAKPAAAAGASDSEDAESESADEKDGEKGPANGLMAALDENLKCACCLSLCERPVTAPCQHNFCLACFKKWTLHGKNKNTCPTCRAPFPAKFAQNPRINTALIVALRLAKNPIKESTGPAKEYKRIDNEQRPDEAFVTELAKKTGIANAASGRIMVTVPNDHFGPIGPEHDPTRNKGVQVGEWWKHRLHCRQWGAHFPHVAGIAGQSNVGAQSVVLSGGYEDDQDEGEWFLYTGSGGRDLSGNKRTNKVQSSDQVFEKMNKALLNSCKHGLPVRVVRSYKEKRSAYAPSEECPVRYDGIYRILRCWRKPGKQGAIMCRYLFVRCDNSPAPWLADEEGDKLRLAIPEEAAKEIAEAEGTVHKMTANPYWDWIESEGRWGWTKPSPTINSGTGPKRAAANPLKKTKKQLNAAERALRDLRCELCKDTLVDPLETPCGHKFCKQCLLNKFEGVADILPTKGARSLRVRKVVKPCPCHGCKADLSDFLPNAQVNNALKVAIEQIKEQVRVAKEKLDAQQAAEGKADGEDGSSEEDGTEEEDVDMSGGGEELASEEGEGSGKEKESGGEEDVEEEEQRPVAKKQKGPKGEKLAVGSSKKKGSTAGKAEGPKRGKAAKRPRAQSDEEAASEGPSDCDGKDSDAPASKKKKVAAKAPAKRAKGKKDTFTSVKAAEGEPSSSAGGRPSDELDATEQPAANAKAVGSDADVEMSDGIDAEKVAAADKAGASDSSKGDDLPAADVSKPSKKSETQVAILVVDAAAVGATEGCAQPVQADAAAGSSDGGAAAADPAFKYPAQLAKMCAAFPDTDAELIKSILMDQDGDEYDTRILIKVRDIENTLASAPTSFRSAPTNYRKLNAPVSKKKATAEGAAPAKKEAAAGKKGKRKATA